MTSVHGVELRQERDRIALHVFEGKGSFEPETAETFRSIVFDNPHGCVIDVGAYTGLYTLIAVAAGAPEIIAIEPNLGGYQRLLQNLEANGAHPGFVKVLMVATSDYEGRGWLEISDETRGICSTGRLRRIVVEDAREVKVLMIDNLERRRPVSVMKIDVEGEEIEVLRGAKLTLEAENPVLIVEVVGRVGDRFEATQAFLEPFGYEAIRMLDARNMLFRVP